MLDDLHWADRGTLHLLRHVARAPRDAPLLIVGTFRDAEVGPSHPLAELLADLRRDRLVERVTLDGLGERDVGALIAAHAGHAAPPALVGTVHEHTDGNPFFVEEVLRHLIETGIVVRARRALDLGADAGRDRRARGRAGGARAPPRAALGPVPRRARRRGGARARVRLRRAARRPWTPARTS